MYLDAFGLKRLPFRLRADPEFVYRDGPFAAAAATLAGMLVAPLDGVIVVSGPAGVGKTTLIDHALNEAQEGRAPLRITQPRISVRELGEWLRAQQPEQTAGANTRTVGRPALLIVEHGERLGAATRRALQQLTDSRPRYRVLIESRDEGAVGETAQSLPAGGVESRILLAPLAMESLAGYLAYRLEAAGATAPSLFAEDACAAMFAPTRGIPRLVNALCDLALAQAAERGARRLGSAEIHVASRDPRWSAFLAAETAATLEEPEPTASADAGSAPEPSSEPLAERSNIDPGERSASVNPLPTPPPVPTSAAPPAPPPAATRSSAPAAPRASAPAAWQGTRRAIEVRHRNQFVRLLRLPEGFLQVGRDRANDLCLESSYVSRRHCELLVSQGASDTEVVIIDSASANGVLVNGRRVRRAHLSLGDRVQVGDFQLRLLAMDVSSPARQASESLDPSARKRQSSNDRL